MEWEAQRHFHTHLRSNLHSEKWVGRTECPSASEGLGKPRQLSLMDCGVGSSNGTRMRWSDTGKCLHATRADEKGPCGTSGKLLDLSVSLLPHSILFL